ncbi:hypothetical protein EUX98_g7389 [Antrodiella citrinella]|uniref:Integrase catalytic domain-containing protein n=1 Tax=Antrodiella citrinella TaxID=2447956 RepID=A0A4S4MLX4_9APHY|nr:hypothetical protein EUX98_g7389 [Antrodiella citrinella]
MSDSTLSNITPLSDHNFSTWKPEIAALLRAKGLWRIVNGTAASPKADDVDKVAAYQEKQDKAAGLLALSLSSAQRIHIQGIEDDPAKIWKKLEDVHMEKIAGSRFNAYDELFSVRLSDSEAPTTLIPKVDEIIKRIQGLRPSDFSVEKLDKELATMTLLKALPDSYNHLVSTLLMQKDLSLDMVHSALKREEINRKPRASPSSDGSALKATAIAKSSTKCDFCDYTNHTTAECRSLKRYKAEKAKAKGSSAQPAGTATASQAQAQAQTDTKSESAGHASLRSSDVNWTVSNDWIVDTGATSHMTPHKHWFASMQAHRVPIQLADKSIIYSEGKGEVHFAPKGRGPVVAITDVLYVPQLGSNLFSALHLTEHRQFRVIISKGNIDFIRDGKTLFNAVVEESNVAKLDGLIQIQTALASTVDRTLLHRRCAHISKERLEKLVKNKLTVNLKLDSEAPLADLCETCIMGKQHRFPFPETSDYSDLKPLDLVVSDVHGPLPVSTAQGYRYWILFLDVASRLYVVYYLREKSQAFACFKEFKAWAENHFERKMKVFRDDKGGEYMSNDMDQYLKEHGIRREHTVRATPQQNGMAERANCTMAEGVTCMLVEAKLPPSFWGEALSTLVYVRNRLPTASLPNHTTPYELAYKKKPSIVHFRVWL